MLRNLPLPAGSTVELSRTSGGLADAVRELAAEAVAQHARLQVLAWGVTAHLSARHQPIVQAALPPVAQGRQAGDVDQCAALRQLVRQGGLGRQHVRIRSGVAVVADVYGPANPLNLLQLREQVKFIDKGLASMQTVQNSSPGPSL